MFRQPVKRRAVFLPDDESDSDSMVRITADDDEQQRQDDRPAVRDQVGRLAAMHLEAASAATDEAAARIRRSALSMPPPSSAGTPMLRPPAQRVRDSPGVATEPITKVYGEPSSSSSSSSSSSAMSLPLSMQANYELLNRHAQASLAKESGAAAAAGQLGQRSAERAAYLLREMKRGGIAETPLPRTEEHLNNPLDNSFFRTLVTQPGLTAPHLNPDTEQRIRESLVPSRRAHEEAMLRTPQSGEPVCAAGDKCKGLLIQCPGGGAKLMAYYTEPEWAKYQDELRAGVQTARLPEISRCCLLCIRNDANRFVTSLRAENLNFRHDRPVIVAPFYNLTDVEGEYRLEDCIVPTAKEYVGVFMPIVAPSLRGFERVIDTGTAAGVVRFRQLLPYPQPVGGSDADAGAARLPAGSLPHF